MVERQALWLRRCVKVGTGLKITEMLEIMHRNGKQFLTYNALPIEQATTRVAKQSSRYQGPRNAQTDSPETYSSTDPSRWCGCWSHDVFAGGGIAGVE